MLRNPLLALAVAALAMLPLAASAQYNGDTLLPSQTVITGTLEQSINSKGAQVGDPFVLDIIAPFPGDDQRFQGAKVYGHVAAVQRASNTKKGGFGLAFDRLTMLDGTTASLTGQTLSLDAKAGGNTAGRAIVGAVIGQIVGNYIGKHIGTDVGGAVGAIGGGIYAGNLGTNVTVGQGSTVALKTTTPAMVLSRRQAYPNGNGGYNNNNNGGQNNGAPAPTPYPTPYH
jgi:hypothetical protein